MQNSSRFPFEYSDSNSSGGLIKKGDWYENIHSKIDLRAKFSYFRVILLLNKLYLQFYTCSAAK